MKFKSMIEQFLNMYLKDVFTLEVIFALDYFCDYLDAKVWSRTVVAIVHNIWDIQFQVTNNQRILSNEFIKLLTYCKLDNKKKEEYECKMHLKLFQSNWNDIII